MTILNTDPAQVVAELLTRRWGGRPEGWRALSEAIVAAVEVPIVTRYLEERDAPSIRVEVPEQIRLFIDQEKAKAWDEGFKQGGPMHSVNLNDPDAHTRNPYRGRTSA